MCGPLLSPALSCESQCKDSIQAGQQFCPSRAHSRAGLSLALQPGLLLLLPQRAPGPLLGAGHTWEQWGQSPSGASVLLNLWHFTPAGKGKIWGSPGSCWMGRVHWLSPSALATVRSSGGSRTAGSAGCSSQAAGRARNDSGWGRCLFFSESVQRQVVQVPCWLAASPASGALVRATNGSRGF